MSNQKFYVESRTDKSFYYSGDYPLERVQHHLIARMFTPNGDLVKRILNAPDGVTLFTTFSEEHDTFVVRHRMEVSVTDVLVHEVVIPKYVYQSNPMFASPDPVLEQYKASYLCKELWRRTKNKLSYWFDEFEKFQGFKT